MQFSIKDWLDERAAETASIDSRYQSYFTTDFGLEPDFYADKRILDVGCGPRGSLRWASMARERVGLDPLAPLYLQNGADAHQMTYVAGYAEAIPFENDHFDIVSSFNSLNSVNRLGLRLMATLLEPIVSEFARVIRPGGTLLLMTDLVQASSQDDPGKFSVAFTREIERCFQVLDERHYEKSSSEIGDTIQKKIFACDHTDPSRRYDLLYLRAQKPAHSGAGS